MANTFETPPYNEFYDIWLETGGPITYDESSFVQNMLGSAIDDLKNPNNIYIELSNL